jgi:ATP-dependent RNA helicase RhlE
MELALKGSVHMSDFNGLAIPPAILERLTAARFSVPTPVQTATIPPAMEGKDVMATAQTGTGKTLAFLVPVMARMVENPRPGISALIVTPTRELAMQIARQYEQIRVRGLRGSALLVGGLSERPQLDALRHGAALVVATPGRLEDFLKRGLIRLDAVKVLVLDEADRMLDIGFLPAIQRIIEVLPRQRQTLCYSATMAPEVARLARACMNEPVRFSLGSATRPVETVSLHAYAVTDTGKLELLQALLGAESGRSLVFTRTKHGADRLAKTLDRDGFTVGVIHGNRSQAQRTKALEGFQRGSFQVLVATDVAARGIHVSDVAHVINYDFPEAADDFVHRVGRTGRAGASGRASTFVAQQDVGDLQRMEKHLGIRLERMDRTQHADAPSGVRWETMTAAAAPSRRPPGRAVPPRKARRGTPPPWRRQAR